MEKRICSSCQHENSARDYFCTQCGAKLTSVDNNCCRIRIIYGEPHDALFVLRKNKTTVGHDCGNIIVLGDELISNKHAVIVNEDNNYWIEDRNSKNGVFVDGQKITKRSILTDGSVIKLGSTILQVEQHNNNEI